MRDEFDFEDLPHEQDALAPLSNAAGLPVPRDARRMGQGGLAVDPMQVAAEYEAVLEAKRLQAEDGDACESLGTTLEDELSEKIVGSRPVWQGSFLTIDAVDIDLPDGTSAVHEVLRHPGAVAIIALDGQGRILLVRQYRTALERITLEVPAGKISFCEDAEECARRELAEETGYEAGTMRYLIPVALAPGYSDEIIHLFMATDLKPGESHPDPDEFVAAEWVELTDLINDVLDGKIEDAKTIISAFACDAIARRLQ